MIAGAQLMVVLDATIVNIALPHIQSALHFSTTGLSWVLNAYTLTFGGLLLLGGRAGDILGRRRVFITGILLFSLASLLGGLATSSGWLLAARALQVVGGAIASPTALALVTTNFAEGPARNRAFGVFAAVSGSVAAVRLLLGGIHELLFHHQQALEDADLWRYADQLGLDRHRLAADLDGRTVWERVQADADSALASGARGTPTLFINGRRHQAGYDQAALGAALATASNQRGRWRPVSTCISSGSPSSPRLEGWTCN